MIHGCIIGPTSSGRYNVIATEADVFILQGTLTLAQVAELRTEATRVLREAGVKI